MRSTAPWCSQDLFFLTDALRRGGMSYAEVAGFLGRDVAQVRDKAKHLSIKSRHLASRDRSPRAAAAANRTSFALTLFASARTKSGV